MPLYEYHCEANGETLEVSHTMKVVLKTWGELCEHAGQDLGDTPRETPIKKLISAVNISVPVSNSKMKEKGFTKLVRRDKGVYENVTATGGEKRYFKSDDPASFPHIKKKIGD